MLARYILCCGPVFVRPSIWLGAEGPGDAKSCRGTGVATSSSMRPIATGAQQWRGLSIHAAYCYRRAAVAWSVHPRGLLLQARSSGVVCLSTRPVAIGAMVEQPGGQRTTCFSSFLTIFVSPIILTSTGRISRGCHRSVPLWL